jgi:hypothetical protein
MTIGTLLKTYEIPQHFGILSIDAEGLSFDIVTGVCGPLVTRVSLRSDGHGAVGLLATEYRPHFIIAEWLGAEHSSMSGDLARHGYSLRRLFGCGVVLMMCRYLPLANIGMNGVWAYSR